MGVEAILEAKRCYQVHLPRSSAFAEWDCVSSLLDISLTTWSAGWRAAIPMILHYGIPAPDGRGHTGLARLPAQLLLLGASQAPEVLTDETGPPHNADLIPGG